MIEPSFRQEFLFYHQKDSDTSDDLLNPVTPWAQMMRLVASFAILSELLSSASISLSFFVRSLIIYTGDQVLDLRDHTLMVVQCPTLSDSSNKLTAYTYPCLLIDQKR